MKIINSDHKYNIGALLSKAGYITPHDLNIAMEVHRKSGIRLSRILYEFGYIKEDTIAKFLNHSFGYQMITEVPLKANASALIPYGIARKCMLFPLKVNGENLQLIMADPTDLVTVLRLKRYTKKTIKVAVATEKIILGAYRKHYVITGHLTKPLPRRDASFYLSKFTPLDYENEVLIALWERKAHCKPVLCQEVVTYLHVEKQLPDKVAINNAIQILSRLRLLHLKRGEIQLTYIGFKEAEEVDSQSCTLDGGPTWRENISARSPFTDSKEDIKNRVALEYLGMLIERDIDRIISMTDPAHMHRYDKTQALCSLHHVDVQKLIDHAAKIKNMFHQQASAKWEKASDKLVKRCATSIFDMPFGSGNQENAEEIIQAIINRSYTLKIKADEKLSLQEEIKLLVPPIENLQDSAYRCQIEEMLPIRFRLLLRKALRAPDSLLRDIQRNIGDESVQEFIKKSALMVNRENCDLPDIDMEVAIACDIMGTCEIMSSLFNKEPRQGADFENMANLIRIILTLSNENE